MRATTPNILRVMDDASTAELVAGMQWYPAANEFARMLDGGDGRMGAGVIAALSPITPWGRNKELALRAFGEGRLTGGTLGNSVRAANRILDGEDPLDVLNGRKVRNFFAAIADPLDSTAVCIDRHAFDIAVGKVCVDADRKVLGSKGVYDRFAAAYARAGRETGFSPSTVQAVTWVVWRRQKGIA